MEPKLIKGTKSETTTFSKSILSTIVFLYFTGAVLGAVLVIVGMVMDVRMNTILDSSMFTAYAAYIGGPTATAIGLYAWKSKAENILKIKNSFASDSMDETLEIISKLEENS